MSRLIPKNRPSHSLRDFFSVFASHTRISKFEDVFARFVGGMYAVTFPYARVAIQALLETETPNIQQDVVLPAYTCSVVAHALKYAKKRSVFCDISDITFNTDAHTLLATTQDTTAAVIPTHMYGNPVDMEPLNKISASVFVIEDCSLSLLPAWKPRNSEIRSASVYSFGSNKHLSTIQGGIVVVNDKAVYERLVKWKGVHLIRPSLLHIARLWIKLLALHIGFKPYVYQFFDKLRTVPGLSKNFDTRGLDSGAFPNDARIDFTAFQAALGLSQLTRAKSFLQARKANCEYFARELGGNPKCTVMQILPDSHLSHFALQIPDRNIVRARLRQSGIEVGGTFDYIVPDLSIYGNDVSKFPIASNVATQLINLPCYPKLSTEEREYIVKTVKRLL